MNSCGVMVAEDKKFGIHLEKRDWLSVYELYRQAIDIKNVECRRRRFECNR